ncbi:MAG: serine hydrolase domain-containing protein [Pseudomonadota bacterium]
MTVFPQRRKTQSKRLPILSGLLLLLAQQPSVAVGAADRERVTPAPLLEPEDATKKVSSEAWGARLGKNAVEDWADSILGAAIDAGEIDAASISVVRGNEVLLLKGYGIADASTGRQATAQTPFRSGSVSKLFTAIAVLQLAERGLLTLDDDINQHLKRAHVDTSQGRTTIRHLLSHTDGFEERFRDTLTPNPLEERATVEYMRRRAHRQVRQPGITTSYSNHGVATAGIIIEDVSAQTYGDYVSEHIFKPLGFEHAGVEFPGKLPTAVAVEHELDKAGKPARRPLLYKAPYYLGSGGFFYSAEDMGKFMRAVLAQSDRLLSPESWKQAWRLQASAGDPRGGAIGLGFWIYEPTREGDAPWEPRIIGHSGATEGFAARMLLFPHEDVGLFFATMRSPQSLFDSSEFSTWDGAFDFVRRFRGAPAWPDYAAPADALPLDAFTGVYRSNRRPYSGAEYFLRSLFDAAERVTVTDGKLAWSGTPLRRIGPRAFERPTKTGYGGIISFSEDRNTAWTSGSSSYTRYPAWHPGLFLRPLTAATLLLALLPAAAALWPRRGSSRKTDSVLALAGFAALLVIATPILWLLAGDHPRLETPRYAMQYALAWLTLGLSIYAVLRVVRDARGPRKVHRVLALSRGAGALGLTGLLAIFIAYDALRVGLD